MKFSHENLDVYKRTLAFATKILHWVGQWDPHHALCDHLERAAGSMCENIAMASAARSAMKIRSLEYAIGSALECAAGLDLSRVKKLLSEHHVLSEKEELSQILRMLIGLRKSWLPSSSMVKEPSEKYITKSSAGFIAVNPGGKELFHHEKLDVYRAALKIAEAFTASEAVNRLSATTFRRLDELITSMVLNIAEGNGRFSTGDQRRFIGTSHESAVKLSARLDLCVVQGLLAADEVAAWKILLQRVAAMTYRMMGGEFGVKERDEACDKAYDKV